MLNHALKHRLYALACRPAVVYSLLICLLAILNAAFHLNTVNQWWFEDDPKIFGIVQTVKNPLSFFYDRTASGGAVGTNEVAPVLLASVWLDTLIASPVTPAVAYWHSAILYGLTAVAFFVVARRFLATDTLAFLTTVTWMMAPSVVAIVEFLSARHYMYGMFFALITVALSERIFDNTTGLRRRIDWVLFTVSLWLAMISKELFPPALLTMLFLRFAYRRVWAGCVICLCLAFAYARYRFWMTDPAMTYRNIPLPSLKEYAVFLARLPYMLFASYVGYPLLGLALIAYGILLRKERRLIIPTGIILLGAACALLTVIPVVMPVSANWKSLGTWYRTPFAIQTFVILLVGLAWSKVAFKPLALSLALLTAATAAYGGYRTGQQWAQMKDVQRIEGQFFLENPDKLYFSRNEAFWFLSGLKRLYPRQNTATYINRWPKLRPTDREKLQSAEDVWILENGQIQRLKQDDVQVLLGTIP